MSRESARDSVGKIRVAPARAIRRCGELLKQIPSGTGTHWETKRDGTDTFTRTEAATQAGLSEWQKVTALRVASVDAVIIFSVTAKPCLNPPSLAESPLFT